MGIFDAKDTRTQREKLEAMANQTASPREAEVAKHMLFKKYGRTKTETREPTEGENAMNAWRGMSRKERGGPVVRGQDDVLSSFLRGEPARSRATHVPGGRRQRVAVSVGEEGAHDLWSYNTIVARRHKGGDISVTPRRYSVTTSKMMGRLQRMMEGEGYSPSGESRTVRGINVPGRWGGWGPAWHQTGFEDLPFVHFIKRKKIGG